MTVVKKRIPKRTYASYRKGFALREGDFVKVLPKSKWTEGMKRLEEAWSYDFTTGMNNIARKNHLYRITSMNVDGVLLYNTITKRGYVYVFPYFALVKYNPMERFMVNGKLRRRIRID